MTTIAPPRFWTYSWKRSAPMDVPAEFGVIMAQRTFVSQNGWRSVEDLDGNPTYGEGMCVCRYKITCWLNDHSGVCITLELSDSGMTLPMDLVASGRYSSIIWRYIMGLILQGSPTYGSCITSFWNVWMKMHKNGLRHGTHTRWRLPGGAASPQEKCSCFAWCSRGRVAFSTLLMNQ